jgi:hypothetical protein
MKPRFDEVLWPTAQLPALLTALGRRISNTKNVPELAAAPAGFSKIAAWIEESSPLFGLETELVELRGFQVESKLRASTPCMIPLEDRGWLGIVHARRDCVLLFGPDLALRRYSLRELSETLCARAFQSHRDAVRNLISRCRIGAARFERAVDALLAERTRQERVATIFPLRSSPGASFVGQLRKGGYLTAWRCLSPPTRPTLLCGYSRGDFSGAML